MVVTLVLASPDQQTWRALGPEFPRAEDEETRVETARVSMGAGALWALSLSGPLPVWLL